MRKAAKIHPAKTQAAVLPHTSQQLYCPTINYDKSNSNFKINFIIPLQKKNCLLDTGSRFPKFLNMAVFWAAAPCSVVTVYRRFRVLFCFCHQAVSTSYTSVNSYQSTRRYNPEDGHHRTHRHENLKSRQLQCKQYSVLRNLAVPPSLGHQVPLCRVP
jgi:hypothetical protein